ncbi:MAG: Ig domain-containing protein [Gammaproteobacteria bacterium]
MLALLLLIAAVPTHADYRDDIGYTLLQAELGVATPDGTGVPVSHIEAPSIVAGRLAWMPNPSHGEFTGKTIANVSGAQPGTFSSHATAVGRMFYGTTTSTSPGITAIAAYDWSHWLGDGFLQVSTAQVSNQPLSTASRVGNHSWIASLGTNDAQALARLDWVIAEDEMLHAVGFTGSTARPLLSSAYNVLSVNRTAGATTSGSAAAGGIYTAGRTKPEIVAPASSPSNATPAVASTVAMLVELGHGDPGLSTDPDRTSTSNRLGDTIYNAERAEVIKAALMAGADRATGNSASADITDYRVNATDRTANGLDRRYGAGQLNIRNSYYIIAAGEQNSIEDLPGGAGLIGATGFDYDRGFGGKKGRNRTATYFMPTTAGANRLTAALVWNLDVDGGKADNFDSAATLYDLDLVLFDVTDANNWVEVAASRSDADNTEHLWQRLDGGRDYAVRVEPGAVQDDFKWDYGLAWRLTPMPPLAVDPVQLADARVNVAYPPQTLTASNGVPPYTWSVSAGALPAGLTLSSGGAIGGTPTNPARAFLTVRVTDANSDTAMLDLQINVAGGGYVCQACHNAGGF